MTAIIEKIRHALVTVSKNHRNLHHVADFLGSQSFIANRRPSQKTSMRLSLRSAILSMLYPSRRSQPLTRLFAAYVLLFTYIPGFWSNSQIERYEILAQDTRALRSFETTESHVYFCITPSLPVAPYCRRRSGRSNR